MTDLKIKPETESKETIIPTISSLICPALADGRLDKKHAGRDAWGGNISPALSWGEGPEGTTGYLLLLEDLDWPGFPHWLVEKISPETRSLAEGFGSDPEQDKHNRLPYRGPEALGTHRYRFTLYALGSDDYDLGSGKGLKEVEGYMDYDLRPRVEALLGDTPILDRTSLDFSYSFTPR